MRCNDNADCQRDFPGGFCVNTVPDGPCNFGTETLCAEPCRFR